MLRRGRILKQEIGDKKRKTKQEPSEEEVIRTTARSFRIKLAGYERTASDPAKSKDERMKAVSVIHDKIGEMSKEIEKTKIHLEKMRDERRKKKDCLKEQLEGKDSYEIRKMMKNLDLESDKEKNHAVLLAELDRNSDQCCFTLERLTCSSDAEVRNRAFDLIQDNLVAVKLTCLYGPYQDIRQKAAKILAKHKNNKYYAKAQQRHEREIIPFPMVLAR